MVPGIIATICFTTISALTAMSVVLERSKGLIERTLFTGKFVHLIKLTLNSSSSLLGYIFFLSFISGASMGHFLLSTTIVHVIIVAGQIALVIPASFFIFSIHSHGPVHLVYFLLFLQGVAGVAFGLTILAFCETEMATLGALIGTLFPNIILSGIIWPLESIPIWFRWISYSQPTTVAIISLRNIMLKGWDLSEPGVYHGFLTTIGFAILFFAIAGIRLKG